VEQLADQVIKAAPAEKLLRVAVADFANLQNGMSDLGRYVASRLTTCLAKSQKFFVVERQRLEQVLAELHFSMSDLVDPVKARQLGQIVGVEGIVVGTVSDLGNQVDLDARLTEIETSRVSLSATVTISEDAPMQAKDWRIELLNQYMYLIGAPFLAIITFYLLLWLNLNRVPLVVLISFSVGLISAPILSRITGIASEFVQTEPPSGRRSEGSTTTGSATPS
jgi:TolB-like protein